MDTINETELKDFIENHIRLLEAEYNEELEEANTLKDTASLSQLALYGLAIHTLSVESCSTIHEKCVVEFRREQCYVKLQCQQHITTGDVVYTLLMVEGKRVLLGTGVVMIINDTSVTVSFEPDLISKFEETGNYAIMRTASFVTYKRMKKALQKIPFLQNSSSFILVQLLFGNASLQEVPIDPKLLNSEGNLRFVNDKLHNVQKEAVDYALKQKNLAIIHGPPGTGKTTTLAEIISQLTSLGNKILLCAPSNVAVDNILETLLKFRVKVVRLGHPARMLNSIKFYSLDSVVSAGSSAQILRDVKKELKDCERQLEKAYNDKLRYHLRGELKNLRKELRSRKFVAQKEVLLGANVVLTTLVTASMDGPLGDVPEGHFDVVIIDECSQALEAACWIALPRAEKVILAGDHLQLPPTVKCQAAVEGGLGQSLMERAIEKFGEKGYRLLTRQFRMNSNIMSWVSQQMYDGRLEADSSVENHLLRDLPGVEETEVTGSALLLVNTAGCDVDEMEQIYTGSRGNEGEANVIFILVKRLLRSGVPEAAICVITPYTLQVTCIKSKLAEHPEIEVKTVDGFQGREKEAVLLSLVRSNARGDMGFICDRRRLNVAVSRARRFLGVVADSQTVGRDMTIASLLEHIEEFGVVHSAQEYLEEISSGKEIPKFVIRPKDPVKKKVNTMNQKSDCTRDKNKLKPLKPNEGDFKKPFREQSDDVKKYVNYWKDRIQKLMFDNECNEYKFSSNLNSYERRMLHEAAESLSLQHESVGVVPNRCIVVRNILVSRQEKVEPTVSDEGDNSHSDLPSKPKQHSFLEKSISDLNETISQCKISVSENEHGPSDCGAKMSKPRKSLSEHEQNSTEQTETCSKPKKSLLVHEQNSKSNIAKSGKHVVSPSDAKNELDFSTETGRSIPQLSQRGGRKSKKKLEEPEDLDALLASFQKLDNTCSNSGCKTSVKLMGQKCEHCEKMFCFSHALPEIHGCGEAARRVARFKFQHPARDETGPDKKKAASTKLKKALSEMSDSRKPKKRGK